MRTRRPSEGSVRLMAFNTIEVTPELELRFWAKVDSSSTGCWPWTGACTRAGYGLFHVKTGDPMRGAHRVAWILANGSVPSGLHILHSCDNPPCCNPSHLSAGTRSKNQRQMVNRGRHPTQKLDEFTVWTVKYLLHRGISVPAIASHFGLTTFHVYAIKSGRRWGHFSYDFERLAVPPEFDGLVNWINNQEAA